MLLPSKKLTPTDLMQGAWFALEQCGHLLRDAVVLFRADRYSSAVGLAMVARDELGKYRLLLDLWVDAASGKEITTKNLQESHVKKQKRAALSAVLEGEESEERRAKFDVLRAAPHDSAERQRAFEDIGDAEMRKNDRERAFYADPREAGWSRPCNEFSREKADRILADAMNDYRGQFDPMNREETFKVSRPGLIELLTSWSEKPDLPSPMTLHADDPVYPV